MSSARLCGNCKAVVPEEHFYCGRCGARYDEDGKREADETLFFGAMQAPGRAKLILIAGEGLEGLSYHLNATRHGAGRGKGVILFPDDNYLDEAHAVFFYRSNQLFLSDDESINGTFLQIRGPKVLEDGDEFLVGRQRFRVEKLDLKDEYSTGDGTLVYVSPSKGYRFRLLHILEGQLPGSGYCSVHNALTIGREGTDVLLPEDRHVCKEHARVSVEDGELVLRDMGSKNGTFLRVKKAEGLHHGDYIFLGSELMRVEINV